MTAPVHSDPVWVDDVQDGLPHCGGTGELLSNPDYPNPQTEESWTCPGCDDCRQPAGHEREAPMSDHHPVDLDRLRQIAAELPRAAYPRPDMDRVHALEDEAAVILGRRTVRQAPEVVSACELTSLMHQALRAQVPKDLPSKLAAITIPGRAA
jgi:hypothetical protein